MNSEGFRKEVLEAKTDDEIIVLFQKYMKANRKAMDETTISVGGKVLTWDEVVDEMKRRTEFGTAYLKALREVAKSPNTRFSS